MSPVTGGQPDKQGGRYFLLDTVRALCALAVCAGHLRSGLMPDYDANLHTGLLQQAFYFLTGLGQFAVMVFFVLSGFLAGGPLLQKKSLSPGYYIIARLTRLLTVLIPALMLTAALDSLLGLYYPEVIAGEYFTRWNSGPLPGQFAGDVSTLLGNTLFLQTILVQPYGTNSPLWSLANEFWYYLVFPLLVLATSRTCGERGVAIRMVCLMAAGIALWFVTPEIRWYFLVWLMGVVAWYLKDRIRHSKPALYASGMVFLILLAACRIPGMLPLTLIQKDLLAGLGFAVFCMNLAGSRHPGKAVITRMLSSTARTFAGFSYSLYAIHLPILILLIAMLQDWTQTLDAGMLYLCYFMLLGLLSLAGWGFWFCFERHTQAIRQWVAEKLGVRLSH
jgi:peptidoglycan/LPS O-acetylase OafA/YrhL